MLPTEDMVKVRIQEKTVAVVREKKKREVWIREKLTLFLICLDRLWLLHFPSISFLKTCTSTSDVTV